MKRILIIDDNEPNREVLGLLFQEEGFETRLLDGHLDIELELDQFFPDVVLMDIMMGKYNGAEICKRIKASPRFNGIKVLLMTASNVFHTIDVTTTMADAHIPKPFDIHEVVTLVDALVHD